jgi:hypothetical protein
MHARNMEHIKTVQPLLQSTHRSENSNILLLAISFLYFVAPMGQHQHHRVFMLVENKPPSSSCVVPNGVPSKYVNCYVAS